VGIRASCRPPFAIGRGQQ
jgi:hypothetical protein